MHIYRNELIYYKPNCIRRRIAFVFAWATLNSEISRDRNKYEVPVSVQTMNLPSSVPCYIMFSFVTWNERYADICYSSITLSSLATEMAVTSTHGRVPTGYAEEVIISESSFRIGRRANESALVPSKKRKREHRGDSSIVYGDGAYKGPWASYEERRPDITDSLSGEEDVDVVEEEEEEAGYEEDAIAPQPRAPIDKSGTAYAETGDGSEYSTFEGSEEFDYQGRTYMHVPQDLDIDLRVEFPLSERKNYCPKRLIHTWKGHKGKINQTRFFPDSGHLLLSASQDSKVMLWDVYHQRELLRSYHGHKSSVVDIDFSPNGTHFVDASLDRTMKMWNTETGTCVGRFSTGATPNVVRINPSTPNEFLAGMSDKKIVQFDTRSDDRKPVQEYDHHLQPVNTVTYCDENRRFISTSDDRSIRAWEYGIPVPIKFIAEPEMFPLMRSSPHPSGKYVAFQSADNQIVVYSTADKFRQHRKKGFRGHNTAGYAIDVAISPDGNIVASGDTAGYVAFWDWKTCKMWSKIQASSKDRGAVLSVAWHPRETSKVVTGALDGSLKYWD